MKNTETKPWGTRAPPHADMTARQAVARLLYETGMANAAEHVLYGVDDPERTARYMLSGKYRVLLLGAILLLAHGPEATLRQIDQLRQTGARP